MKIESPAFTQADVEHFMDELSAHDQSVLADRLERASQRLAELGPRVTRATGGDGWTAH